MLGAHLTAAAAAGRCIAAVHTALAAYQRTMQKLVKALQTSIAAEAEGAKENEVRCTTPLQRTHHSSCDLPTAVYSVLQLLLLIRRSDARQILPRSLSKSLLASGRTGLR